MLVLVVNFKEWNHRRLVTNAISTLERNFMLPSICPTSSKRRWLSRSFDCLSPQIFSRSCISISNLRCSLSRSGSSGTFASVWSAWIRCGREETEVSDPRERERCVFSKDVAWFRVLLGLGSSKPWEDILEDFAGVRTFSAQACLRYFQPLRDYLEDLVARGELTVGWSCPKNGCTTSTYNIVVVFGTVISLVLRRSFSE